MHQILVHHHCLPPIILSLNILILPDTRNVSYSCDSVGNNHAIPVADHLLELVYELIVLDSLLIDFVELGDAHHGRFSHVGVLIVHGIFQWVAQVV